MRILLISNQGVIGPFVGNPIMIRLREALLADERIDKVNMLRCKQPFSVIKKLRNEADNADIIHVHFGGLYALCVWFLLIGIRKPKLITFHGTDVHAKALKLSNKFSENIRIKLNQYASFLCVLLYDKSGFVAKELIEYLPLFLRKMFNYKWFIQPLGVNYDVFRVIDKDVAQGYLGLIKGRYVLFSDVNNTTLKRRDLAIEILKHLGDEFRLLIMCGVDPDLVPYYINSSDFIILTSDEEGSPNIIREALSLNKPVFSVNVGDALQQLKGLNNSRIISRNPVEAASEINNIIKKDYIDNTRSLKKSDLDFSICNKRVVDIYINLQSCSCNT